MRRACCLRWRGWLAVAPSAAERGCDRTSPRLLGSLADSLAPNKMYAWQLSRRTAKRITVARGCLVGPYSIGPPVFDPQRRCGSGLAGRASRDTSPRLRSSTGRQRNRLVVLRTEGEEFCMESAYICSTGGERGSRFYVRIDRGSATTGTPATGVALPLETRGRAIDVRIIFGSHIRSNIVVRSRCFHRAAVGAPAGSSSAATSGRWESNETASLGNPTDSSKLKTRPPRRHSTERPSTSLHSHLAASPASRSWRHWRLVYCCDPRAGPLQPLLPPTAERRVFSIVRGRRSQPRPSVRPSASVVSLSRADLLRKYLTCLETTRTVASTLRSGGIFRVRPWPASTSAAIRTVCTLACRGPVAARPSGWTHSAVGGRAGVFLRDPHRWARWPAGVLHSFGPSTNGVRWHLHGLGPSAPPTHDAIRTSATLCRLGPQLQPG